MFNRRKPERESSAPVPSGKGDAAPQKRTPEVHIGPWTCLTGELFSGQETLIEGLVEGRVVVVGHRLTVGPKARVVGPVVAQELVLMGSIEGDVEVQGKVEIHKDGHLEGDVHCLAIRIDEGAFYQGTVDPIGSSAEEDDERRTQDLGNLSEAVGESETPEEEPAQEPPGTDWAEIDDVNAA